MPGPAGPDRRARRAAWTTRASRRCSNLYDTSVVPGQANGDCSLATSVLAGRRERAFRPRSAPARRLGRVRPGDQRGGPGLGQDGAISYGGAGYGILFGPAGNGSVAQQGVGVPQPVPAHAGGGPGGSPSPAFQQAAQECVTRLGVRNVLTYQPTYRYWPLQWYETAIFVGLALILAGFCFFWLRRRYA